MDAWTEAWTLEMIRTEDPITLSSYFIEQKIPFEPSDVHHAINLLLHIIAAILLLKNLEALKLSAAFPAALIFALHPTALQTIFWSGYREEIIGLILILAALYFGIQNRNSRDFFIHTMICFIAYLTSCHACNPLLFGLCIFYKMYHLTSKITIACFLYFASFVGVWTRAVALVELEFGERLGISAQNFSLSRASAISIQKALFYPFYQSKGLAWVCRIAFFQSYS